MCVFLCALINAFVLMESVWLGNSSIDDMSAIENV